MTQPNRLSASALAVPGIALVVAFFMPWIDVLGAIGASGYDLATADGGSSKQLLLWASPILGAVLAFTALADSKSARSAGLVAGLAVIGPTFYYLGKAMMFGTSWGLWMVVAGAIAMIAMSLANKPDNMLWPAAMVVAGFFLPWTTKDSSFASWGMTGFDIARLPSSPLDLGLPSPKLGYLVPIAGLAAGLAVLLRGKAARTLGTICGVAVLGWLAWFIGKGLSFFTGWGLWLTIGAGAAALIMSARR
jgi:hypothetical protein